MVEKDHIFSSGRLIIFLSAKQPQLFFLMFLYCLFRCYSPGPILSILVALEKRTPCIWWGEVASHCEQNEMWSEKQPSLASVFPICSCVKHLQHTVSPARSAGKASRWHCSALHTELVCKHLLTGEYLERHGRRSSKSLSMLRQPLLYQHKGIASALLWGSKYCFSFHSSTGYCCQPSVQVYFSFRCEEGDKVSIYWIWGTSCQHSCSAKQLHVQRNPSASGWDLQPFVPFSLGPYCFLQWSGRRWLLSSFGSLQNQWHPFLSPFALCIYWWAALICD